MTNVEQFHSLLVEQVDWLSDAETRLVSLRRPSRLVDKIQYQLNLHEVRYHQLLSDLLAHISRLLLRLDICIVRKPTKVLYHLAEWSVRHSSVLIIVQNTDEID